jgi:hypothetical protein
LTVIDCAVLSGGLDSLLVHWDFSRGRPIHHHDLVGLAMNSPQVVNPPFVHSIDVSADANVALAALGDNSVLIYDLDRDLPVVQLEDGHSTSVSQACVGRLLSFFFFRLLFFVLLAHLQGLVSHLQAICAVFSIVSCRVGRQRLLYSLVVRDTHTHTTSAGRTQRKYTRHTGMSAKC